VLARSPQWRLPDVERALGDGPHGEDALLRLPAGDVPDPEVDARLRQPGAAHPAGYPAQARHRELPHPLRGQLVPRVPERPVPAAPHRQGRHLAGRRRVGLVRRRARGAGGEPTGEAAMTDDWVRHLDQERVRAIDAALAEVRHEALTAIGVWPPFHSPHEGFGVLLEEVDELWDEVKAKGDRRVLLHKEARQVAA